MAPNQYRHIPLSSSHSIRILKLLPSVDRDSPIIIDLEEVRITMKPKYRALSYAWGEEAPSCPVRCGNKVLLVTPNCLAAMRQLRDRSGFLRFWIDSICIDQSSPSERSAQVALMGEIYRDASMVIVWLGEGDQATEDAIEFLISLTDVGPINMLDAEGVRQAINQKSKPLIEEMSATGEDRIGPFFNRSWFTRLWTVQEVTLAQTDEIYVVCGSKDISWSQLIIIIDLLRDNDYRECNYKAAMELQTKLNTYIDLHRYPEFRIMLEQDLRYDGHTPSISYILFWARGKATTDPRDKIFGIFGIFKSLGIETFTPDYTKSVEEIYKQAAMMAILHDRELDILLEAASDNRRAGLNSWVPDWSDTGYRDSDMRGAITDGHFYAAPADPSYQFSSTKDHLCLRGKLVDKVIYRAETINLKCKVKLRTLLVERSGQTGGLMDRIRTTDLLEFSRDLYSVFQIMRDWTDVSRWRATYPAPGETPKTALRRTLLYGGSDKNEMAEEMAEIDAGFEAWYQIMTTSDLRLASVSWGQSSPVISITLAGPEESQARQLITETSFDLYFIEAMAFSNRKCLFTTEKGYLGTAPDLIRDGDCVAVVAGVCMPLVLRPVAEGRFRLVTHAYVHGIMHGEAWPEDKNSSEIEEIVLV